MSTEMLVGTVKWFDNARGYGYIVPDGIDTPDPRGHFVHYNQIVGQRGYKTLEVGQRVRYRMDLFRGKPQAFDVEVIVKHDTVQSGEGKM